ncbi:MAG: hypothetical protein R3B74_11955 [Nitrospirales bacterium]|nr:hypothetical protein [Nitrospirales bacterium]
MASPKRQPRETPANPRPRRRSPAETAAWKKKAVELARLGVTPTDIGKVVQVDRTTVSKYLQKALPEFEALQPFQDRLGDSLMLSVAHHTSLEDKLLKLLEEDDVLAALPPQQKERLLGRATLGKAINYDKWRQHTGKSTANISHRIILDLAHGARDWGASQERKTVDISDTESNPEPQA